MLLTAPCRCTLHATQADALQMADHLYWFDIPCGCHIQWGYRVITGAGASGGRVDCWHYRRMAPTAG